MQSFWEYLWTGIWFAGLGIFSVLSVLVIIFGGFDLVALLRSLHARHLQAQATDAGEAPLPDAG